MVEVIKKYGGYDLKDILIPPQFIIEQVKTKKVVLTDIMTEGTLPKI